jgi:hypothetical protein
MSTGFFQKTIVSFAPEWLRGHYGSAFLEACGLTLDIAMQRLVESVRAGQPLACYPDALPRIAAQRGLRIYETEPLASKRYRLSRWLQLHHARGTHRGEMEHLQPYFLGGDGLGTLPTIRIVHRSGNGLVTWHTLSGGTFGDPTRSTYSVYRAAGDYFNFDDNGANSAAPVPWDPNVQAAWSRWWAFIELQGVDTQALAHYDDANTDYDDPDLYYDGISGAIGADLVAMLRDWKAAHSALWGVALSSQALDITAAPTQDADGWWNWPSAGEWGKLIDGTTHLPTRPPYLTWLLDRSQT